MNREQIEKAIDTRLDEPDNQWDGIFNSGYSRGFKEGAHWRINSVWHTDINSGNTRRAILVRFNNGLFNVFEDIRDLKGIEDLVGMFAYLDDLIPERKEETNGGR